MKKRLLGLMILVIIAVLALVGCDNLIVDVAPVQYTVSFDVDGGSYIAPIKVNKGAFATRPQDPTKEGFDFAGWYKDAALTEKWIFTSHKITGNTTIYAKWIDHTHAGGRATCEESAVCSICGEAYGDPLGHTVVVDAAIAPTCGQGGLTEGSHCSKCNKVLVAQEEVPATGSHAWGEWDTDTPATEDADGTKHRDCSVCGAKEEGVIPSLNHTHSHTSKVTVAPGCETTGTMTFTCGCGDSYTEEIPATGHAYDEGKDTVAPGCETKGTKTFTCQNDASHTYTEEIPATGHTYDEGVVSKEATYGHKGTKTFTCANDASHTKTEDIAQLVLADDATAAEIVDAAYSLEKDEALIGEFTLTGVITKVDFAYNSYNKNISITIKVTGADESKTIYCYKLVGDNIDKIVVGDTVTITGPIKNYNGKVEFDQGCELVSYTEHEHQWSDATCKVLATCSICKKTTGEFADHSYGTDGICTVCEHDKNSTEAWVLVTNLAQLKDGAEIIIVAAEYNFAMGAASGNGKYRLPVSVAKNADGTVTVGTDVQIVVVKVLEDGSFALTVGGKYLYTPGNDNHLRESDTLDANSTWTITISGEKTEIKSHTTGVKNGNSSNILMYNANSGQERFSCYAGTQKGVVIYVKTTAAAHTHTEEVIPGKAATCTATGLTEGKKCSECGEILLAQEEIKALGHNMVTDAAVAPTCESTGLTEGSHCSRCDHKVAQTTVAALGHKWNEGVVTTDPTCEGKGVKTFTCLNDSNHTKTEDVAATGHTASEAAVIENKVDATCTANGSYDSVVYCSVCDDEISRNTVTVPASGHKAGENNTCTVCGANLCGDNHTEVTDAAVAPTCTATGLTEGSHCSKCGYIIVAQEVVDALGHNMVKDEAVAATCTTTGLTEGSHCSRCDHKVAQETVAALGHTPVVDAKVDPTCTETGLTEGSHCSVCEEVLTAQETVAALGHTPVVDAKVDPTCTETGLTEGSHCSVCEEVLAAQETVSALGHADENGDYKCDACSTKMLPEADSTLTLAQAIAVAKAMGNAYTTDKYYITCEIKSVYNVEYGNMNVKDAETDQFIVYGLYTWDKAVRYDKMTYKPVTGDEITVYGVLGCYKDTPQMKDAWLDEVVAHEHDYADATCTLPETCTICDATQGEALGHTAGAAATCTTDQICTVCETVLVKAGHIDENENCRCDVCKANLDTEGTEGKEIVFNLGENGEAEHVDGDDLGQSKSYENGEYTLALTEMSKVYGPAYDLKGNSCIKLGTGNVTAKLTFTVPDDVTSVVINIAKYKAKNSKVNINGKEYTLTKSSNDGQYDVITVDTSTTKTITLATIASNSRAMIDSIVFVVPGNEGAKHVHNEATREEDRVESTCTVAGHYDLVTYCTDEDCGEVFSRDKVDLPLAKHTPADAVVKDRVESTCKVAGYYYNVVYCSNEGCGAEISRTKVELELADHSYNAAVTAPTCEAGGYTTYTCSVCQDTYTADETDKLGHNPKAAVKDNEVAPSCTVAGSYDSVVYCDRENCGAEISRETVTVPATGHTESEWIVDSNATCTEPGSKHQICTTCKDTIATETIPATDHAYDEGKVTVAPGCETEGEKTFTCQNDTSHTKTEPVAATGHAKVQHEAKAATCTDIGWNAYETCNNCSYTTYVELAALGHKDENSDHDCDNGCEVYQGAHTDGDDNNHLCDYGCGKAADEGCHGGEATCTEQAVCEECGEKYGSANGHKDENDDNVCDVCQNAVCSEGDHKYVGEVTTDPTCTTKGETTYTCSACGDSYTEEIAIDKDAHDEVAHEAKAATCTKVGNEAYVTCSRCDYTTYVEIPATGHTEETIPAVGATCEGTGLTEGVKCSVCKEVLTAQETVSALGHTEETIPAIGATCESTGLTAGVKCSVCNEVLKAQETVSALGHTEETIPAVGATCEGTGLTEGVKCSVCKEVLTAQETVSALGHTEETIPAVGATCEGTGLTAGVKCSVCDEVLTAQTVVPAAGHTEEVVSGNAATCTESGLTDGKKCSDCGETLTEQETIPATGHIDTATTTVNATCTEAGSTTVKCNDCGETVSTEEIYALGHEMTINVDEQAATCTTDGYSAHTKCSRCDYTEGKTVIPASHNLVDEEAKDATCTEDGWNAHKACTNCDYTEGKETATATGHKDEDASGRCDVCNTRNSEEGVNVTFEFGANGSASHNDGSSKTSYTETVDGYTLNITTGTNMYTGAKDATGNSCIKLGTSKAAGSFTFTVPDNVTSVVIHVAAYKANTATVDINGTKTVLTTKSNNGQYDAITVDTSETKTVSLTVSSGYRAMVNSIEFVSCGHEWKTEVTNATCLTDGSITDTCTKCEVVEKTTIEAIGHNWGEGWVEITPPTETTDGEESRTCNNCGTTETNVIPSLAHQHSFVPTVTDPTCTEQGYTTYNCACGEDSYKDNYVDALGHEWDDGVVTEPTCTEDGYTTYTCGKCETTETREEDTVDALGHNDEDGDFECDHDCGTIIEPEAESTLTLAQAETLANLFAHNTYTTNKYYITCEIEKVYDTQYGNINIVGSKFVIYGLYSEDGKTRYDAMTYKPVAGDEITVYGVIGKYNTTLQMKNGWLDEVVAHEHDYTSVVTDPTCTEDGYTTHTCSICDNNYTDSETEALGHTTDNGTCERCNETIGGDAPVLEEKTYSYTFGAKQWTANGDKTLNDVKWTLAGNGGNYWGYDATKGQQFGSGSAPYTSMTLTSGSFSNVSQIVINTSGASSIAATLKVYVGSTLVKTITLTKTATDYTIDVNDLTGEIKFEYTQTSKKAIYIKSISVTYAE